MTHHFGIVCTLNPKTRNNIEEISWWRVIHGHLYVVLRGESTMDQCEAEKLGCC